MDPRKHFTNPSSLANVSTDGHTFLVIGEDPIGLTGNRVPEDAATAGEKVCEIYWLDLSLANATPDNLVRFMVAPAGAAPAGLCFTPDGMSFFASIQRPSPKNPAPFDRSATIAVTGYKPEQHLGEK
jgi:secreted PhoX family phosphatase